MTDTEVGGSRLEFGASIGAARRRVCTGRFTVSQMRACGQRPDRHLHVHDCVDLLLPLDGGFYSEAAGFRPDAPGRQIIFTPAGRPHRDSMEEPGGRFLTISIGPAVLDGIDGGTGMPRDAQAIDDPRALRLAYLMSAALAAPETTDAALEALGFDLVAMFAAHAPWRGPPPCVAQGVEIIRNSPADAPVSIAAIASEAGVHPVYFARAFRRAVGCSPSDYAMATKVARAARLLARQEQSLAGLAAQHGFADQSHFSRCFRRLMGVTPGRFRRCFA